MKLNFRQRMILYTICLYEEKKISLQFLSSFTGSSIRTIRRDIVTIENMINTYINIDNLRNIQNNFLKIIDSLQNTEDIEFSILEKEIFYEVENLNKNANSIDVTRVIKLIGRFYLSFNIVGQDEFKNRLPLLHPEIRKQLNNMINFETNETIKVNANNEFGDFTNEIHKLLSLIEANLYYEPKIVEKNKVSMEHFFTIFSRFLKKWIGISLNINNIYFNDLYRHVIFYNSISHEKNEVNHENKRLEKLVLQFNQKNNVKLDQLSLPYIYLIIFEEIYLMKLKIVTACTGGQGTSVMLKSILSRHFSNSEIDVIPIERINAYSQKNKYDILILVGSFDEIYENSILISPIALTQNNFLILKETCLFLLDKLQENKM